MYVEVLQQTFHAISFILYTKVCQIRRNTYTSRFLLTIAVATGSWSTFEDTLQLCDRSCCACSSCRVHSKVLQRAVAMALLCHLRPTSLVRGIMMCKLSTVYQTGTISKTQTISNISHTIKALVI